jgi:VWFA-related protein
MSPLRTLAAAGLLCASVVFSQAPPPAEKPEVSTLNVSARLVTVPVTVRDKKGQLVATLKQEDFTIAEDGKPQVIRYFDRDNNLQLTLGLLVDVSGSQRNVLDEERTASSSFLDNMLVADRDQAFIIQFGHTVELLADVTGSIPKLQSGLKKVDTQTDRPQFSNNQDPNDNNGGGGNSQRGRRGAGGAGTALYDAIFLASDEVIHKQQFRKALILLTDGEDNGSKESMSSAIEAAQRADTAVYSIYFKGEEHNNPGRRGGFGGGGFPGGGRRGGGGPGSGGGQGGSQRAHVDGKKILQRISDETGGRFFEVSKKEPLAEIYKQIAQELRSQYRIGFTPTNQEDGYHKILVDTPKDRKLFLQAREGYYTGSTSSPK